MGKVDYYRAVLKKSDDWDQYLLDESCLPGARANLELAEAVAQEGDIDTFRRYLTYHEEKAPYGSALEFLPVCGVIGLGRLVAEGRSELLEDLRLHASDHRWRVREGVAIALQKFGDKNMSGLLDAIGKWSHGNLLERRAVVAAICEPRLLKNPDNAWRVLTILDHITDGLVSEVNRKNEDF
ncbi:MAG: hypothetical protein ABRQ25_09295 [Clostridiaceae bacterium]